MSLEDSDAHHPHIAALRRRYLPILLANLVGGTLTVCAYFWVKNFEDNAAFDEFRRVASQFTGSVGDTKNKYWQLIYAANDPLILGSKPAFEQYAQRIVTEHPAIELLAWLPQIEKSGSSSTV